jgi:diaminopimelate epimerase
MFLLCRSRLSLVSDKRRSEYGNLARLMCSPVTGAGADGLLALGPAKDADFTLEVFNADGSWAERSGNGLRAAVVFAQKDSPRRRSWRILCGGDIVTAKVLKKTAASEWQVAAEVGSPKFDTSVIRQLENGETPKLRELVVRRKRVKYLPVTIGNPHAIIPVRTFPREWVEIARGFANHRRFIEGVNVEFVRVVNRRKIEMRIFERGVGPTGSSGTGASASVAVMKALGKVGGSVTVESLDLQSVRRRLDVSWVDESQPITVKGSVKELLTAQTRI